MISFLHAFLRASVPPAFQVSRGQLCPPSCLHQTPCPYPDTPLSLAPPASMAGNHNATVSHIQHFSPLLPAGFRLGFACHPASPQFENLSETYPCPAAVLTPLGAKLPPACDPQAHSGCGSSEQVSDLFSCHFAPRALHPNHAGLSAAPEPSRTIPTVCTAHPLTSCKSLLRGQLLSEAHLDRSLGSLPTHCFFWSPAHL